MDLIVKFPVKKGDLIYTVEKCKIVEYYVTNVCFSRNPICSGNLSESILVSLNRYNSPKSDSFIQGSYKTEKTLSECFLSKDELIENL